MASANPLELRQQLFGSHSRWVCFAVKAERGKQREQLTLIGMQISSIDGRSQHQLAPGKTNAPKSPAEVWNRFQHKETTMSSCVFQEQGEKAAFVTKIISWELFTVSYSGYWQGRTFSLGINNQMWELGKAVLYLTAQKYEFTWAQVKCSSITRDWAGALLPSA